MADQKVTISITTLGNTAGADAVSKSLKNVSVSAGTLTDKVSVSTWGVYDLDKAVRKVNENVPKVPPAADAAAAATKKWGFLASQTGVQIGDFTTQVSMGTSMAKAFSMQAPQVLGLAAQAGLMGTKMALALTGVGAAIPLITMAAPALMSFLTGTADNADVAAGKIDGLGEKLARISSDKTASVIQKLEDAETLAENLRATSGAVEAARSEAAKSALSDNEILAQTEREINVILGIRVDKLKELREEHRRAAETRAKEMRDQAQTAQREIAEMRAQLADKTNTLEGAKDRLRQLEEDARKRDVMLAKLTAAMNEKEAAIADEPAQFLWETWFGKKMYDRETTDRKQKAADEARASLPDTQNRINELTGSGTAADKEMANLKRTILLMESGTAKQAKFIEQKVAASAEILEALAKSDRFKALHEQVTEVKAKQDQDAESVSSAIKQLEAAGSDKLAPTIAALKQVMADNVIAANEAGDVQRAAATLSLTLKNSADGRAIISALSAVASEVVRQDAEARAIKKQVEDLKRNQS